MPTVVINHDLPLAEPLEGRRDDLEVVSASGRDEALTALSDAEILVCNPGGWDERFLDVLEADDWIQVTSAGYDAYPIDAIRERGVTFTNATGNYGPVVAEHAFAMALAFTRMIPQFRARQRERIWGPRSEVSLRLSDWKDHTLTVYGLGNIGESIAERGLAFEMDVYGIKRDPAEYDGCLPPERVRASDELLEVLPGTDLLVAIVPLTEATRGSIDADVFEALPDSAILVNVARGAVVDEDALIEALRSGEIAGAGLDVFEDEPLPESSPLWDRDDVILTPHIAGRSNTFPTRFAELFLENYDRRRAGETLVNQVV